MRLPRQIILPAALLLGLIGAGSMEGMPKNEELVKEQVARLLQSIAKEPGNLVVLDQRELEPKAQPGPESDFHKLVRRSAAESAILKIVRRDAVVSALKADAAVQQRAILDPNAKPLRIGRTLGADFVLVSGVKNGKAKLIVLRAKDETEIAAASFHYDPSDRAGESGRGEPALACGNPASFEGWACAPDTASAKRGEGPGCYCKQDAAREYLYVRFTSTASAIAIHSGRMAGMQSTCREAAAKAVQNESRKILTEYLKETGVPRAEAVTADLSGGFPNRPGASLVECCSLNPKTGKCADPKLKETETWETCRCTAAFRYPGGRKAFDSAVESAAKKKP